MTQREELAAIILRASFSSKNEQAKDEWVEFYMAEGATPWKTALAQADAVLAAGYDRPVLSRHDWNLDVVLGEPVIEPLRNPEC